MAGVWGALALRKGAVHWAGSMLGGADFVCGLLSVSRDLSHQSGAVVAVATHSVDRPLDITPRIPCIRAGHPLVSGGIAIAVFLIDH